MIIGCPKEIKSHEYRVALTPSGVKELVSDGHEILIENFAGAGSGISDEEYSNAGASISSKGQLFKEAELIVKVKEPLPEEYSFFKERQAIFTFLHLAPNRKLIELLLDKKITGFAYETLEDNGRLPLLVPMSEIAGRMSPIIASFYLQKTKGGCGILPAGAVGVPPARTVIIGAGVVGTNAAFISHALGMRVTVLNKGIERLSRLDEIFHGQVTTLPATSHHIEDQIGQADILIGAIMVKGEKTPVLVSEDLVAMMKKGSVIVDVSVDQGGCIETIRPTTHDNPVYAMHGVTHYAVSNMPGAYPATSTPALTNSTLQYIKKLSLLGIEKGISEDYSLQSALNTYNGKIVHKGLAESTGFPLGEIK